MSARSDDIHARMVAAVEQVLGDLLAGEVTGLVLIHCHADGRVLGEAMGTVVGKAPLQVMGALVVELVETSKAALLREYLEGR